MLAAGGSSRFGASKLLARFDGESMIRLAIRAVVDGGCRPVVVVLGYRAAAVRDEITDLEVDPVVNADWRSGMASSISTGMGRITRRLPQTAAVLLLGSDQPRIDAATVGRLLHASEGGSRPVACAYAGTVGIPAIVTRGQFPALLALRGESGAKQILLEAGRQLVRVDWADGALDVDRPEDLRRISPARREEDR